MGYDGTLTAQEVRIAFLHYLGHSLRQIAADPEVEYESSHVHRILQRPHVKAEVSRLHEEAVGAARRAAGRGAITGVQVLTEIATDPDAPHSARVQAAATLVRVSIPTRQEVTGADGGAVQVDVASRIDAILAGRTDADLGIPDTDGG